MSYLMNSSEILQTIQMIDQQHLDVRTVTMGVSLPDCADVSVERCAQKVYEKLCHKAERLVPVACEIEQEYGIPIVNKRISVTPIALIAASCVEEDYTPIALAMDRASKQVGIDFIGGFSALAQKGFTESDICLIRSLPRALTETALVCGSVNVGSTKAGINMDAVRTMGTIIRETAERNLPYRLYVGVRYAMVNIRKLPAQVHKSPFYPAFMTQCLHLKVYGRVVNRNLYIKMIFLVFDTFTKYYRVSDFDIPDLCRVYP